MAQRGTRARAAPRRAEVLVFGTGDALRVGATPALILAGVWIVTPGGRMSALVVALLVGAHGLAQ